MSWAYTTQSNALLLHNATAAIAGEQHLYVKIKADTAGDQLRAILGYTDADNWCAVEIEFGDGSGVMRFLESTTTGGLEQLGDDVPIKIHLAVWYTLQACVHDGVLAGRWVTVDDTTGGYEDEAREIWQYRDVVSDGDRAGVGTGTVFGNVAFDDFIFDIHQTDEQTTDRSYTSCPNCEQTCTVFTNFSEHSLDDPYWEIIGTGGWEYAALDTWVGTPNSYAICQVPQSYDGTGMRITATIDPSGSSGETRTTWLIGDIVDIDNFHALKVVWTEGPYKTYAAYLIKRSDGVDATIADFTGSWWPGVQAQLCLFDDAAMGTVSDEVNTTTTNVRATTLHGGRLAGMAVTGTHSAGIRDWSFQRHKGAGIDSSCHRCTGNWLCGDPLATCVGESPPPFMKVVIDGLTNGEGGYDDNGMYIGPCDNCDVLNGIYILHLYYTNTNMCSYIYEPLPEDCLYVPGWNRIILNFYQYGTGQNTVEVSMWYDGYYGSPDVSWSKEWNGDCSAIEDMELAMSWLITSRACAVTGATCFITSVAE